MVGEDLWETVDPDIRVRPVSGYLTLQLSEMNMRRQPLFVGRCECQGQDICSDRPRVLCVACGGDVVCTMLVMQKVGRRECTILGQLRRV